LEFLLLLLKKGFWAKAYSTAKNQSQQNKSGGEDVLSTSSEKSVSILQLALF